MFKLIFFIFLSLYCKKEKLEFLEKNYSEKNYIKVLKEYPFKTENEKYFANLAILNLNLELENSDDEEKKKKLKEISKLNFLKLEKEKLKTFEISESSEIYEKYILESFIIELEFQDEDKIFNKLKQILELNPNKEKDLISKALIQFLKKKSLTKQLDENTNKKFWDRICFFSDVEKPKFFLAKGKNINLRLGPGVENPAISKISDEEVFLIEEDFKEVEISKKKGKWFYIYSLESFKKGWIFSGFLEEKKMDISKFEKIKKEITEEFNFQKLDFEDWDEKNIPKNFYGSYFPKEKMIESGKTYFPIDESDFKTEICFKPKANIKKLSLSFKKNLEKKINFLKLKFPSHEFIFELDDKNLFLQDFSFPIKSKIEFIFQKNQILLNKKSFYESEIELEKLEICFPSSKNFSESRILLESIVLY